MNTARLNQDTPLLLNAVSKHYAENIVLNQLDLHIPAGQFVAVVAKVPCCACWPGWKRQPQAMCWQAPHRWLKFRKTRE